MVDNIHSLCPPAIIYLVFSFTQIIIDMFKGLYNTAFFKFIVMLFFTFLLNVLCMEGLSIISWIIVFIPFMMMSIVTALLLFVFGLDPATGKLHYKDLTKRYNGHGKSSRRRRRRRRRRNRNGSPDDSSDSDGDMDDGGNDRNDTDDDYDVGGQKW